MKAAEASMKAAKTTTAVEKGRLAGSEFTVPTTDSITAAAPTASDLRVETRMS
jgi:hypothetical protein